MNFKEGAYLTLIRNVGDAMNLFEFFRKKKKLPLEIVRENKKNAIVRLQYEQYKHSSSNGGGVSRNR